MKNQSLFSLKDKSKKVKCRLLYFLLGALRLRERQTESRRTNTPRMNYKRSDILDRILNL